MCIIVSPPPPPPMSYSAGLTKVNPALQFVQARALLVDTLPVSLILPVTVSL